AAESDDEASDEEGGNGVSRYMFVMARLNEDIIEQPELESVPEASDDTTEDEAGEEAETDREDADNETESDADTREEVIQRNQRKQDEYNDKVAKAKARVAELNDRFGDWYYVIADDVYKKVALGRDELIVAKEPEEGDDTADEPDTSGPLGSDGATIPGLPNVPGVNFDPSAGAVEDAIDSAEEAADDVIDEASDAAKEAVDTAAETVEQAVDAVKE
ncbi:MAG: hypothetical protein AAF266_07255, partial [Planctomycetota bacterium]